MTDIEVLQAIVGSIDAANILEYRPEITLSVKGTIIRGELISAQHFFTVHAEYFRSSDDSLDAGLAAAFERLQEIAEQQAATNAARLAPDVRFVGPQPDPVSYLHLVGRTGSEGLWRVRIADIDAWTLGIPE